MRALIFLVLCLPVAVWAQTAPADSVTPAPPKRDTTHAPADPAAYLRRQTPGPVPGSAVPGVPEPTGSVRLEGTQNQQVLTPTGFQNSQGVGTNVTFTPKPEKKRRRDD